MKNSVFIGQWKNPKKGTKGIRHFDIVNNGNGLEINATGASDGYMPGNWGTKDLLIHNTAPDSSSEVGFQATYEINEKELFLAGNINKGLIIIAIYIKLLNQEDKSHFFIREFFYKKQ